MQKVLAKPEVPQRLERVGVEAGTLPSAQFQKLLDADFVSAGQIVKAAGTSWTEARAGGWIVPAHAQAFRWGSLF
ncbi:UNVERIFIED_ORG: DNA mismatch repair protein MutH [Comamonas terrigena]